MDWSENFQNELLQDAEDGQSDRIPVDPSDMLAQHFRDEFGYGFSGDSDPQPLSPVQSHNEEDQSERSVVEGSSKRERDSDALPSSPPKSQQLERQAVAFVDEMGGFDMTKNPKIRDALITDFNRQNTPFQIQQTDYGHGLFARTMPQSARTVVGEYTGLPVPIGVADNLPKRYDKVVEHPSGDYAIVGDIAPLGNKPSNYVMFCNDPGYTRGIGQSFKNTPNAALVQIGTKVFVQLIRPVRANSEITVDYGYKYWEDAGVGPDEYWPDEKTKAEAFRQYLTNQRNNYKRR